MYVSERLTMPSVTLHYFNFTGRGELIRLVLAAANQKYEDHRFKEGEWATFKEQTPFGQCPAVTIDGKMYGQTFAICTYFAREAGLYGKSNLDGLGIDQWVQLVGDIFMAGVKAHFEKDEAKKAELNKELLEVSSPKYMGYFEKALGESKSGYLVGDALSLADIAVYELVTGMMGEKLCKTDDFPKIKALCDKVAANPGIKAYKSK